jgi:hypothetical protein
MSEPLPGELTAVLAPGAIERGRVVNAKVLQGAPMLTEATLEAVKKWGYTPRS